MDSNGIIDLTEDEPETGFVHPVGNFTANPHLNHFPPVHNSGRDPFPELHNAFQAGARPQPADAFNQDTMTREELAEFMIRPPPAAGYVFNHHHTIVPSIPNLLGHASDYAVPTHRSLDEELFGGDLEDLDPLPGTSPDTIANLIENIKPDEEVPPEKREQTPRAMCSQLMEHQKLALTWLKKMEEGSNKGGILADEMGLGKTVQALALVVARPSTDPTCRTTLIIAPVALMRQWEKEIQRHIKDSHRLKVHVYHGTGKNADFHRLRQFDVVLTTFGTLGSEFKQKETRREAGFVQQENRDPGFRRKAKDKLALLGPECMWYRIIIDEAQCIKNKDTQVSKASAELQARHRLVMTGTPMMNSIDELYPLIRFLQIKPYNDNMRFRQHFSKMIKEDRTREKGMQRVQALLKSIMLRRQKTSKIDGEEICKIPPKHTHHDSVEFTDDEHELYKAIEGKTQLRFNKYLKAGTVTKNYAYILVLLLRLRQACCHPHLIKDLGVQVSTEGIAEVDLLERAKLLEQDAVGRIKAADGFECGICMDAVVNPTIFIPCGHDCCGECFQKLVDPAKAIREGNEHNGPSCHICRGPLTSDKITDYRHFCKVFSPEKGIQVFGDSGDENSQDDGAGSGSELESEESDDDDDDLDGFIVPDDAEDDFEPPVPQKRSSKKHSSKKLKESKKAKGKAPAKPKTTLAQLKQQSMKNKAAKRKYLRRLRKDWITSSKIEKTLQLVSEIRANDPTEKILVFSQFTSLLDLLEVPLDERSVKYQRYDGSMKMDDRAEAVNRFMDEPDQQLMLISLKAGNAGLNLNKASQVIILDPFWNPFIEDQAVDRAHRMPQQREVHVHRVLVPETVEDRICELQNKKRDLITSALDENAGKSISRLGVSELMYLFGMRERPDDRAN
ncbi:hypothetical protein K491DRAFT_585050 [Lophiostoma macrostomum CBS 122681]|uniref:SWI/SNF family DNA-dependent ATPase Ris1 n=1 Tax=Lophiostoma macrostomum CBS 122681 TaxID=1314788 RepID=A0A6A6TV23_9PLEO|nr:hypothetical protein K491DRAFT_585050 [Lophiostoma macrostomum CBS 122681]